MNQYLLYTMSSADQLLLISWLLACP